MIEEVIKKISTDSGLSEAEIRTKIDEKKTELSDLISDEGAAYIVAKELGIKLIRTQERLKLANVIPGMQNVDVVGKVTRLFPVRAFSTDRSKGKVLNITIADETGSVRMSLWNDEINKIELAEGDVIRVRGYVIEDNLGGAEIRLGRFGNIQESEETIENVAERGVERSEIKDLGEGQYKEIRACLLQIFESKPFYEICSECGARLKENKCKEHGDVEADYGLVVSGIVDDGTGSMRAVFFNQNAEVILGMTKEEGRKILEQKNDIKALLENISLGEEYIFEGRVRRNDFFDRLEFIVNRIKNVGVKKEIEMLLGA